jgi:hydrogenase-4 component E
MMLIHSETIIKILFVLVLLSASFIIMQKTLSALFTIYRVQSLMIALIAVVLFIKNGGYVLLALAILTVITKVLIIPYMLNRVRFGSEVKRDGEFRYLTPVAAIVVGIALVFLVYNSFFQVFQLSQDNLFFLGAVVGVSLSLIGMLVVFCRKKVVTKTVGYLTMENGILLFSLFMAELPFIIELLIIVDLIIFILLATVLAFGIDSTEEAFHNRLNIFTARFGRKDSGKEDRP